MRLAYWIALGVVVAVYLVYAVATVDRRADEPQIRAIIEDAAAAVEARSTSGAMAGVSRDYKDESGLNYDRLRMLAAQGLSGEARYSVRTDIREVEIDGDRATVQMHVKVNPAGPVGIHYDRDLTVVLARESGRHLFVIPVKVWRVTSVSNMGFDLTGGL